MKTVWFGIAGLFAAVLAIVAWFNLDRIKAPVKMPVPQEQAVKKPTVPEKPAPAETPQKAMPEPDKPVMAAKPEPAPAPVPPEPKKPDMTAEPAPEPAPVKEAETEPKQPEPVKKAQTPPAIRPSFDIVRVEPDGSAVIAGRAAPGWTIAVMAGDKKLGQAKADARGEWVVVSNEKLEPGTSALKLTAISPDGTKHAESAQTVAIARPEAPKLVMAPEHPSPPETSKPPQMPEKAEDTKPEPKITDTAQTEKPAEPLVVVSEKGQPSKVLQIPETEKPAQKLAFKSVDYDDEGEVILSGAANPGSKLRIYLDNKIVAEAVTGDKGNWVARTKKDIKPGQYTLRVDHVSESGKVASRIEAPFERAVPKDITEARKNGEVIIQPGDNLWNLSSAYYGQGMQYTVIYEANKSFIRNPDRIYPGQVLATPGANPADAEQERDRLRKRMLRNRR